MYARQQIAAPSPAVLRAKRHQLLTHKQQSAAAAAAALKAMTAAMPRLGPLPASRPGTANSAAAAALRGTGVSLAATSDATSALTILTSASAPALAVLTSPLRAEGSTGSGAFSGAAAAAAAAAVSGSSAGNSSGVTAAAAATSPVFAQHAASAGAKVFMSRSHVTHQRAGITLLH
jgi:hypothetical protein